MMKHVSRPCSEVPPPNPGSSSWVCPWDKGYITEDRLAEPPISLQNSFQNSDENWVPWSDITSTGIPWRGNNCFSNTLVISLPQRKLTFFFILTPIYGDISLFFPLFSPVIRELKEKILHISKFVKRFSLPNLLQLKRRLRFRTFVFLCNQG